MSKKSFVKGAIILGFASIICKILGAIFRISLTYIIGSEGMGIFQLVYPIFALFLVASTSGLPVGLSKIISREYTKGNYKNTKIIFSQVLKIMIFLGFFFAALSIVLSRLISSLQGNVNLYICYFVLAPSILLGCMISAFRGYYQGFEIMKYSAISQIIEQLFKVLCSLLFTYIFIQYGLIYGVCGALFGLTVSEFVALIFLLIIYRKNKLKIDFNNNVDKLLTKKTASRLVVREALPITITSMISSLATVIESLIIIKLLNNVGFSNSIATSLYGLDSGVVASLINLPSVIVVSIGISLMPSLSSSFALKNTTDISQKSKLAIKLVWYLTIPFAICFFVFSKEICFFLYGKLNSNYYDELMVVSLMLKLCSFSIIYIALNQIFTTILQAINESYFALYVLLFANIIRISLTIVLVLNRNINVYGLIISDVICYAITCVINLAKIRKLINLSFSFKEVFVVPFVANFCLFIILFLFKKFAMTSLNRPMILVSMFTGFFAYFLIVILLKGFNFKEISKTKIMKIFNRKRY